MKHLSSWVIASARSFTRPGLKSLPAFGATRRPIFRKLSAISLIALLFSVGNHTYAGPGHDDEVPPAAGTEDSIGSIQVETIKSADLTSLGTGEVSYAGELLSSADRDVYAQRSGPIGEWLVRVGDKVKKGQPIARLAAPPVTVEQVATLAAQLQAVERARSFASASERIAISNRERFERMRAVIDQSKQAASLAAKLELQKSVLQAKGLAGRVDAAKMARDSAIKAAQAEAQAAQSEWEAAQRLAESNAATLRSSARRLLEIVSPKVFTSRNLPSPGNGILGTTFITPVGVLREQSRDQFLDAYWRLTEGLQSPDSLPPSLATDFIRATNTLLANSITTADFSDADLQDLRERFGEEEQILLEADKGYKEAQAKVDVGQAEVLAVQAQIAKVGAEEGKSLAESEAAASLNDLDIKASQAQLDKIFTDIELEYQKQKNEIDLKQADTEREVEVARSEAEAAQKGYRSILSGVAGTAIVAPVSGTVSAINVLSGQNVSPDLPVAIVTGDSSAKSAFVRFSVPGDLLPPPVGDIVTVERQDYPFDRITATVTGVGRSLNHESSITVEAELHKELAWPVGSSLRVRPTRTPGSGITIPIAAIRLNAQATPRIWIVTKKRTVIDQPVQAGRSIGDRIEILSGLQSGDVVVTNGQLPLRDGQSLDEKPGSSSPTPHP